MTMCYTNTRLLHDIRIIFEASLKFTVFECVLKLYITVTCVLSMSYCYVFYSCATVLQCEFNCVLLAVSCQPVSSMFCLYNSQSVDGACLTLNVCHCDIHCCMSCL